MIPITPIGTRILRRSKPLGGFICSIASPTGSDKSATWRTPTAICAILSLVNCKRSIIGGLNSIDFALSISTALAFKIVSVLASKALAKSRKN